MSINDVMAGMPSFNNKPKPECEELFSKITDEIDNDMKTEILQEFEKNFKYDYGYYYKLMNWMNSLNTCGVFLKIYKDPTVSKYIDDLSNNNFSDVSKKMQTQFINVDCTYYETDNINNLKTTETTEYINDMRRKLINYYKFLCVDQYLEKFKLPTNGEFITISDNMSENVYYLELPINIQNASQLTISYDDTDNMEDREKTEYYISRGFLSLGRLESNTKFVTSNFLDNIQNCLTKQGYTISNEDIIKNLWKVKSLPTIQRSNGGKRKTMRNKKVHRKRKTMKRAKMRRTRHRKRVNSRHSKKNKR